MRLHWWAHFYFLMTLSDTQPSFAAPFVGIFSVKSDSARVQLASAAHFNIGFWTVLRSDMRFYQPVGCAVRFIAPN